MSNNEVKIIAETAYSHEGSFNYLIKQIELAAQANVDYVKFQLNLKPEEVFAQEEKINSSTKTSFSEDQWLKVLKYSKSLSLNIVALPLGIESAKFCIKNENLIDAYEIHSITFCEEFLLKEISQTRKKIILGIGGRRIDEIDYVINFFKNNQIILMHGFQSFPTKQEYLNLAKIESLKKLYPYVQLGYADHTKYDSYKYLELNNYAFLLGARWFEKHIVIKKGEKRVDFHSAIDKDDFMKMKISLNSLVIVLGERSPNILNDKERIYRAREKKIIAIKNIRLNEVFDKNNIGYRIKEDEISFFEQSDLRKILGRKSTMNIQKGEIIKFKHVN